MLFMIGYEQPKASDDADMGSTEHLGPVLMSCLDCHLSLEYRVRLVIQHFPGRLHDPFVLGCLDFRQGLAILSIPVHHSGPWLLVHRDHPRFRFGLAHHEHRVDHRDLAVHCLSFLAGLADLVHLVLRRSLAIRRVRDCLMNRVRLVVRVVHWDIRGIDRRGCS